MRIVSIGSVSLVLLMVCPGLQLSITRLEPPFEVSCVLANPHHVEGGGHDSPRLHVRSSLHGEFCQL